MRSAGSPSGTACLTCIARMQTAETPKVAASRMNAQPVPMAISNPPISGPSTVRASGWTTCPIEFASTSCSFGTIVGTIEWNAGPKSAAPAPYGMTRSTSSGIVS